MYVVKDESQTLRKHHKDIFLFTKVKNRNVLLYTLSSKYTNSVKSILAVHKSVTCNVTTFIAAIKVSARLQITGLSTDWIAKQNRLV